MDAAFLERLALSFVIGGAAVALFTTAAERYGSRFGGLLLSFPVKVTLSLILIALQEGAGPASVSAAVVPMGLAANVAFLVVTVLALRRIPRGPALALGMAGWLAFALLTVLAFPSTPLWALGVFALVAGAGFLGLTAIPALRGTHHRKGQHVFNGWRVVRRGLAAGLMVALTLVIARYGDLIAPGLGPVLAGVMAVFPSGFFTTMVVLSREQGPDFTGATARTMIAGSAAPVSFGLVVALTLAPWGVLASILAGLATAGAVSASVGAALGALDARLRPEPAPAAAKSAAPVVAER